MLKMPTGITYILRFVLLLVKIGFARFCFSFTLFFISCLQKVLFKHIIWSIFQQIKILRITTARIVEAHFGNIWLAFHLGGIHLKAF